MVVRAHNWVQESTCLNGPHVWRCQSCRETTRSFGNPHPHAALVDPDTGETYSGFPSHCANPEADKQAQFEEKLLSELSYEDSIFTADGKPCGKILDLSNHLTAEEMRGLGW